jgi:formate dehydrogenase major subunit
MHAGMSYARLEQLGGIQWPCYDELHEGEKFLHARLWDDPMEGPAVHFHAVEDDPPVDELTDEYPLRLTTGRTLESFNTGVQTDGYASPIRRGGVLEMSPEDAAGLGVEEGEEVRIVSRRGELTTPVHIDPGLRPGLVFIPMHFPGQVDVNRLTIDAWDPQSGTAEFKATAVRVERRGG